MMNMTIKSISFGIIWVVTGVATAMLFMQFIKASIKTLSPGKAGISAFLIPAGAILRWVIMAALLYLSIRMDVVYALLLVGTFSITRFVLVYRLSIRAKQDQIEQSDG